MNESNRAVPRLVFLVLAWYISSSVVVLVVKALFSGRISGLSPFPFPLTITATSNIISAILAMNLSSPRESVIARSQQRYAMIIGATTAGEIGLSNWALELLTLVLATMMKGVAPLIVFCWGVLLGVHKFNTRMCVVTITVCVGLVLAVSGQKSMQESSEALLLGVTAQFLSGVLSGLRWIITQIFIKGADIADQKLSFLSSLSNSTVEPPVSARAAIRITAPWTAAAISPFVVFIEGPHLAQWLSYSSATQTIKVGVIILTIGILVFFVLLTEYALVKSTSSLTVSMGFVAKEVVVIFAGTVLFGDRVTTMSVAGFFLVQVCILLYALQRKECVPRLPR